MLTDKLVEKLLGLGNIGLGKIRATTELFQIGVHPDVEEDRQLLLKLHEFNSHRSVIHLKQVLTEIARERYPGDRKRVVETVRLVSQVLRRISQVSFEKAYWLDTVSLELFGLPVAELPAETASGITLIAVAGAQIDEVFHITVTRGGAVVVTDMKGQRTKLIAGTFTLRLD